MPRPVYEVTPERKMWTSAKWRAKEAGLAFDIRIIDVDIPYVCPILGIPIFTSPERAGPNSPSLDRVDNSKGYVRGNVRVISHRANTIKSDLTLEQAKQLVLYISGGA